MSGQRHRWCKRCDRITPHDHIGNYDSYTGLRALWVDYLLFSGEVVKRYQCQRCGKKKDVYK